MGDTNTRTFSTFTKYFALYILINNKHLTTTNHRLLELHRTYLAINGTCTIFIYK